MTMRTRFLSQLCLGLVAWPPFTSLGLSFLLYKMRVGLEQSKTLVLNMGIGAPKIRFRIQGSRKFWASQGSPQRVSQTCAHCDFSGGRETMLRAQISLATGLLYSHRVLGPTWEEAGVQNPQVQFQSFSSPPKPGLTVTSPTVLHCFTHVPSCPIGLAPRDHLLSTRGINWLSSFPWKSRSIIKCQTVKIMWLFEKTQVLQESTRK